MKFVLQTQITRSELHDNIQTMIKKKWSIGGLNIIKDSLPEGMTIKMFTGKEKLDNDFENQKVDVDFLIEDGDPKMLSGLHLV